MTERTVLDRLMDDVPVGHAPIDHLLAQGRAAKRRKRRAVVAGAAAATTLVVGGSVVVGQGLFGSGKGDGDIPVVVEPGTRDLTVQLTVGVPKPLAALTGGQAGSVAIWDPDDRTLAFVPEMGYSSSCPPLGTAESTARGAVTLTVLDDPAPPAACNLDLQPVTVTIEDLTDAPAELTVTVSGATTTVPVIYGFADRNGLVAPGTFPSQVEIATAEAVARAAIEDQGASVTSASVIARRRTVKGSNTGHPCTSDRELQIRLIGKFPHTGTTGHPVEPGAPTPDFTVRAMNIIADAESGLACRIGVQTGENGTVKPLPGSTMLLVGMAE